MDGTVLITPCRVLSEWLQAALNIYAARSRMHNKHKPIREICSHLPSACAQGPPHSNTPLPVTLDGFSGMQLYPEGQVASFSHSLAAIISKLRHHRLNRSSDFQLLQRAPSRLPEEPRGEGCSHIGINSCGLLQGSSWSFQSNCTATPTVWFESFVSSHKSKSTSAFRQRL